MEFISGYFEALVQLTVDMAPYLMLGFLFAGLLKVFLPAGMLNRYLGNSNFKSVANASLLGVPLPLCSCGVLPAGISLYKNGASRGSSVSFLISTPQTGLDSILVTWSMLGLPFALLRPIAAFFTGIVGGVLTNRSENKSTATQNKANPPSSENVRQKPTLKGVLRYAYFDMVDDIAKWLVIGLLIAALIAVLVPDNFFSDFRISGLLGMLIILVVSIPLYICATSSVPIAAVLLLKGLSPGAMLVFLMAGPATNAATMTVIGKNLGRKTLLIYLGTLIGGALLFGLLIDYLLPGSWFLPVLSDSGHAHHLIPGWLGYLSAIVLTLLIMNSFINRMIQKHKSKNAETNSPSFSLDVPAMIVNVDGMTCEHCKAKVENGLKSQPNIKGAVANLEDHTVNIYGEKLDIEKISQVVSELGYIFKGKKS